MKILSLGAGVQSTTVLLMSCVGELPKLDAAIFADTQWEPKAVYKHLEWLKWYSERHGIPVYTVSSGDLRLTAINSKMRGGAGKGLGKWWASMPLRTVSSDGSQGIIRRQCTKEYKIDPITKKIREMLGLKKRQRFKPGTHIEQWFGISVDEVHRMRTSGKSWSEFVYPLVDRRMSRQGCNVWLESHGFPVAPRSACIGCPYHSNEEWRKIKADPEEWADAVEFDNAIRDCGGMRGKMYLHRDCKPLEEVDLRTDVDKGQLVMSWAEECDGLCGV